MTVVRWFVATLTLVLVVLKCASLISLDWGTVFFPAIIWIIGAAVGHLVRGL